MKHQYSAYLPLLNLLGDLCCLNVAFWGAHAGLFLPDAPDPLLWAAFNIVWVVIVLVTQPYVLPRMRFRAGPLLARLLWLTSLHLLLITLGVLWRYNTDGLRPVLLTYALFLPLAGGGRLLGLALLRAYRLRGYNNRRYVVVGYGPLADTIRQYYAAYPEMGFHFFGYFDERTATNTPHLKGTLADLPAYIRAQRIDYVYGCQPYVDADALKPIVDKADALGYEVKLLLDFRPFLHRRATIEYHDLLPVMNLTSRATMDWRARAIKRTFDVALAVLVLTAGSPLLAVIGFITKLTSTGPALYVQERIGRGGRVFRMYKFRSMYVGAEPNGPALSLGADDTRITPWGRIMRQFRLDELPQFYNVLRGDMAVVGPRPERQFFIDQIVQIVPEYRSLFDHRPGLTSLGQVRFGYASTVQEMTQRLRFDLLYVRRQSFALDLWIVGKTLRVMLTGQGR